MFTPLSPATRRLHRVFTALEVARRPRPITPAVDAEMAGADVNTPFSRRGGMTVLMAAARAATPDGALWLLDHGAELEVKDGNGWTALAHAAAAGRTDTVRWLLARGADPNTRSLRGHTPLMHAVDKDYPEPMKPLLAAGADLDAADQEGWTALIRAVQWGATAAARLLLEHGADPNARDGNGETVLMGIRRRPSSEATVPLLRLLLAAGADPSRHDATGHTTPEVFMARDREDLVAALDNELACPAQALARCRLLDRLTTEQCRAWLPKSCAAATAMTTRAAWSRRP